MKSICMGALTTTTDMVYAFRRTAAKIGQSCSGMSPVIGPNSGLADDSQRSDNPTAEDVMAQLERLVSSQEFAQSDRLKNFLRFVVTETLAGRGATLKEYAIAIDVFERDASFDPQTSSIVRVEASRLRSKLEKYAATAGRDDPVGIVLPRGTYVPTFHWSGPPSQRAAVEPTAVPSMGAQRRRRGRVAAVLTLVIIGAGGAAFLVSDRLSIGPAPESRLEAPGAAEVYSLAVLPLRNLSGHPAEDYFSQGITEALITDLAKSGRFRVTSLPSAMAYANVDRPVSEIARELGVSHLIKGSVLRIGDMVRITAQLIEAESDRYIWAQSYESDLSDVLGLQNKVVAQIVSSLPINVSARSGTEHSENAPAIDPVAYEAYLRGRFFRNKMTEEGFKDGIRYFKLAMEKAPTFAPAYSGMATCYCLLGGHGFELVEPSEGMPAAKKAVLEALRLDDTLAEAHAFLGIIRLKYEWDWNGAEQAFRRSIELNPSYAQARIFYSYYMEIMGRREEAIRQAETAKAIDPLSLAANINLGWQYLRAGQLEQARQIFESTAELDPTFWGVHWGLGQYYRRKGQYSEAIKAFRQAISAGGGHAMPLSALGYTYAISKQPAEAREMLDRLIELSSNTYVSPFNMAVIHAGLDEKDKAFEWLEMAYAHRSRSMAWLNVSEELEGLRSDSRFKTLLRRIGLEN